MPRTALCYHDCLTDRVAYFGKLLSLAAPRRKTAPIYRKEVRGKHYSSRAARRDRWRHTIEPGATYSLMHADANDCGVTRLINNRAGRRIRGTMHQPL